MLADGADISSLNTHYQMAAVTAFPQSNTALFEDSLGLNVVQQLTITLSSPSDLNHSFACSCSF